MDGIGKIILSNAGVKLSLFVDDKVLKEIWNIILENF